MSMSLSGPPAARTVKAIAKVADLFDGMNQLEKRRAMELEALKRTGVVSAWRYEKITLKLADDTRYTPDFWIVDSDGAVSFDETKGHWRDDAKVKIKVAAEQFPEFTFRSLIWNRQSQSWDVTNY